MFRINSILDFMESPNSLTILAIDCAAEILSIGVSIDIRTQNECGNDVRTQNKCGRNFRSQYFFEADAGQRHSELLLDAVSHLISIAGIQKTDIDAFACMEGPGSFTGLRIGFSAVKGFALALGKKIITVPTLDCIACSFTDFNGLVVPVLDAKQKRFFASIFYKDGNLSGYLDISAQNLLELIKKYNVDNTVILCGNGARMFETTIKPHLDGFNIFIDPACCSGRASLMLKYIEKTHTMNSIDIKSIETNNFCAPLYIRKSDAEINAEANRL